MIRLISILFLVSFYSQAEVELSAICDSILARSIFTEKGQLVVHTEGVEYRGEAAVEKMVSLELEGNLSHLGIEAAVLTLIPPNHPGMPYQTLVRRSGKNLSIRLNNEESKALFKFFHKIRDASGVHKDHLQAVLLQASESKLFILSSAELQWDTNEASLRRADQMVERLAIWDGQFIKSLNFKAQNIGSGIPLSFDSKTGEIYISREYFLKIDKLNVQTGQVTPFWSAQSAKESIRSLQLGHGGDVVIIETNVKYYLEFKSWFWKRKFTIEKEGDLAVEYENDQVIIVREGRRQVYAPSKLFGVNWTWSSLPQFASP